MVILNVLLFRKINSSDRLFDDECYIYIYIYIGLNPKIRISTFQRGGTLAN